MKSLFIVIRALVVGILVIMGVASCDNSVVSKDLKKIDSVSVVQSLKLADLGQYTFFDFFDTEFKAKRDGDNLIWRFYIKDKFASSDNNKPLLTKMRGLEKIDLEKLETWDGPQKNCIVGVDLLDEDGFSLKKIDISATPTSPMTSANEDNQSHFYSYNSICYEGALVLGEKSINKINRVRVTFQIGLEFAEFLIHLHQKNK